MNEDWTVKTEDLRPGMCFLWKGPVPEVYFIVSVHLHLNERARVDVIDFHGGQMKHAQWLLRKVEVQFESAFWLRVHE